MAINTCIRYSITFAGVAFTFFETYICKIELISCNIQMDFDLFVLGLIHFITVVKGWLDLVSLIT
jgi:hypothetical protein